MATAVLNKYRVKGGVHYERTPDFKGNPLDVNAFKAYERGSVIESNRELDVVFPNKFERLKEEDLAPAVNIDTRRPLVDAMIAAGPWQEEDRRFLEKLSEENFERMRAKFDLALTQRSSPDRTLSNLGDDVTSNFQVAYDHQFKVFKNAKGKMQVTNNLDFNKPLNKEPLDAKSVDSFIEKYLKEQ